MTAETISLPPNGPKNSKVGKLDPSQHMSALNNEPGALEMERLINTRYIVH